MPSLLEALTEGFNTNDLKPQSGDFNEKLKTYRNTVVNEYLKYQINLNKAISDIAKRENLNDDQIQRIVEEVNNQIYLIKYNEMKHSSNREVVFDLASLQSIKAELAGTKSHSADESENKEAFEGTEQTFEKKAGWEGDSASDKLNALNYSAYDFGSLSVESRESKETMALKKVASDIKAINREIQRDMEKVAEFSTLVGNALVEYKKFGLDVQDIFDTICKSAECSPLNQLMIKKAAEQKVARLKDAGKLFDEFSLELESVNITKEANPYSLNGYSFSKEADFNTGSNQSLPIVITDAGAIKSINDLVQKVTAISDHTQKAKEGLQKKDDILTSAGLSEELAEKVAAAGSGLAAFGKSLLGTNVGSAKKDLKKVTKNLAEKIGDKRMADAQSAVDILNRSKKNIDLHPRMKDAVNSVSRAFDKHERISSKADAVLNQNALKSSLNPSKYFSPSTAKARVDRKLSKMELQRTKNMANKQSTRIKHDLSGQISNAERKLMNVRNELGVDEALQSVRDAEKAYNKAISSRNKARGVALVGAGAGVALNEERKKKQKQQNAYYY